MDPDRWRRVEALFHAARERSPDARPAFLEAACPADGELQREVLRLLSNDAHASDFLEHTAAELRREVERLLVRDADAAAPEVPAPEPQSRAALEIGRRIGPYEIESVIAAGGMGEVYKARDIRLDRTVAIKILPPCLADDGVASTSRTSWRVRFEREAKAIASLNHPNVCALHDLGEQDGVTFLVMEHIDGQTLADLVRLGPLSVDAALNTAIAMADALAAAHRQGLVHRDFKPANVMVTAAGRVKVLDFGLAKHVAARGGLQSRDVRSAAATIERPLEGESCVVGTAAYMSPEQAEGAPLDARSDVFSFGAVLYELLTARRAFPGHSLASTMSAVLHESPTPVHEVRGDVPPAVEAIVIRCLEKNRDARYPSAVELREALADCRAHAAADGRETRTILREARFQIPAFAVVGLLLAGLFWSFWQSSRVNWARTIALPEIARLIDQGRNVAAMRLARRAERYLPHDPEIARLRQNHTRDASFKSNPPGADVHVRDYIDTAPGVAWEYLGRTPLRQLRIPAGHLAYRISKAGYTTAEGYTASAVTSGVGQVSVTLDRPGSTPPGMVRVAAPVPIGDFWLDKYEVTNRRYQEFVDGGGYTKAEYWDGPFVEDGRPIGWERAVSRFTDATGRLGPGTWRFGAFPRGHDDHPVSGVSWYEAAAYCKSLGKALPTIHHWRTAAHQGMFATILETSNFNGRGPAPVGSYAGIGPFGTYDAAGNVREWCLNASADNRILLGGAWDDPKYLFLMSDSRPAGDRSSRNGFRCSKYEQEPPGELTAPVDASLVAAGSVPRVASDEIFRVYKALHAYDHGELDARIDSIDDGSPFWRQEKVSFRAAYGNDRVAAYLFLPRNAAPPFQAVVTFPGVYALDLRSSARLETQWFDFFMRSGRAVVHPIYKGMYERTVGGDYATYLAKPNTWRELAIQWHKDLGRSLDYLDTRSDFDHGRYAYHGISLGTTQAPRLLALEPRLKVAVLFWGGFLYRVPAEVNPLHFASRSTVPTLMITGGRTDPIFPEATSQLPMFRLLATPDADKRRIVVEGGHVAFNDDAIRQALSWLDKYLGPVRTR